MTREEIKQALYDQTAPLRGNTGEALKGFNRSRLWRACRRAVCARRQAWGDYLVASAIENAIADED